MSGFWVLFCELINGWPVWVYMSCSLGGLVLVVNCFCAFLRGDVR